MNIQQMMKQAEALQKKFKDLQDKMANVQVTGKAGGGLVKVTTTGKGEPLSIHIDESLLTPSEAETLNDLIIAAFRNAKQNADSELQKDMNSLGIPPEMMNFS